MCVRMYDHVHVDSLTLLICLSRRIRTTHVHGAAAYTLLAAMLIQNNYIVLVIQSVSYQDLRFKLVFTWIFIPTLSEEAVRRRLH